MNLAAFEAFVKVMETGSISLAADHLFITQPAVTKRIHSLEDYFGVKLFESAGRGVQATHAAHSLLPKVKGWLNELGDIHHTLSHEQDQVQGKLKIGTSHHLGLHHLPHHLKEYVQQFPNVKLDVHFVDSEQAHEQAKQAPIEADKAQQAEEATPVVEEAVTAPVAEVVVPKLSSYFQPILVVPCLQLIAYEVARLRGCDIDKPKNLAKSVTVE